MFKRNALSAAALLAVGSAMSLPSWAQQQPQRVEVTGSAIKRINAEGPAPVEIITKKDIEKTGATTVNELIRSIPSIDIFDQGELASNSPAGSGTANVGMRGLSQSETLVLLNGRRLPLNALYDSSGAGAAFDINSIPISAIERVEILKDGGSAIYGADAVAGVLNFITKSDYQGGEGSIGYGQSSRSDGKEKKAGLLFGFGDLSKDRFNVMLGVDVLKRDPILRKDRDLTRSVDFRSFGSSDGRSSFAPQGNIIDPVTGGFVNQTYTPCPAENTNPAGRCRYDFNASLLTSYNGADRVSGLAIGSFQITPDIKAFAEVVLGQTKDHFEAHPVPDFFVVPITNPSQRPFEIPADYGLGPDKVYIAGRFMQGGPRITDRKSEISHVAVGVDGVAAGLDFKAHVSRGESKVSNQDRNYYDADKWVAATTSGQLNPTVTTNDPAFVESLKLSPLRTGKSVTEEVNLQVGGDAFNLPGGTVRYAVGAQYRRESLSDQPDAKTQAGDVVGSIQQAPVDASRSIKAVFAELSVPVLKSLESQIAVRYDKYPGVSQTSPKVGFKYTPVQAFALRGSYTESFRAPVLKQLYGAQEQGAITITQPAECQALGVPVDAGGNCQVNAFQVNGANLNLKPETGKTFNIGLIFEAGANFNASVDWWRVKKKDEINSPTIESAIRQGLWSREGARFNIFTNLQNIAERENEGVDVDARFRIPNTAVGTITFRESLSYYNKQRRRDSADEPMYEYNGTYALPRWRNTFSVSSEMGPWAFTGALRSVAGFIDEDDPPAITSTSRKVGVHDEVDLQVQYMGIKGLTLTGGVKNLLDKMPPFSATNATDNQYTQMGFAELYSPRGRFFYLSLNYKFF
jgi:iron complex outermembrane receptor protein